MVTRIARLVFLLAIGLFIGANAPAMAFLPLIDATGTVTAQTAVAAETADAPVPDSPPTDAFAMREPPRHDRLSTEILIHVSERPLSEVLNDLARIGGLRMRLNDRLERDIVAQRRLEGTLEEVFDSLATDFNLVWFAERDLIDIARADTATVKTFQIGRTSDRQIRDALDRFGLVNADFALEVDESNGIARVFAPPRLSARIESIIVGLRAPVEVDAPVEVIRFGQRGRPGE